MMIMHCFVLNVLFLYDTGTRIQHVKKQSGCTGAVIKNNEKTGMHAWYVCRLLCLLSYLIICYQGCTNQTM